MIYYFKICIRCIDKCFCKNDFVWNNQDTRQSIMSMYWCEETKMQIEWEWVHLFLIFTFGLLTIWHAFVFSLFVSNWKPKLNYYLIIVNVNYSGLEIFQRHHQSSCNPSNNGILHIHIYLHRVTVQVYALKFYTNDIQKYVYI